MAERDGETHPADERGWLDGRPETSSSAAEETPQPRPIPRMIQGGYEALISRLGRRRGG